MDKLIENSKGEWEKVQWLDMSDPFVKSWFILPTAKDFKKMYG